MDIFCILKKAEWIDLQLHCCMLCLCAIEVHRFWRSHVAEIVYPRPTVFCSTEKLKWSYNWLQQFEFVFLAIFETGIVRSKSERMGIAPFIDISAGMK